MEQIASLLVLPQVDKGLRSSLDAAGVPLAPNGEVAGALARLERAATRTAIEKLRHNDSTCILEADLVETDVVNATAEAVLREKLPPFSPAVPLEKGEVRIAYLVQVSKKDQLHLIKRTFDRLYSPLDTFLYETDAKSLPAQDVREALAGENKTLPANVQVRESRHAGFFFYPRVAVLLAGVEAVVKQSKDWDVLVHLSESGYPLHRPEWIRRALGMYRHTSFIESVPYRLQGTAAEHEKLTATEPPNAPKPALRGAKPDCPEGTKWCTKCQKCLETPCEDKEMKEADHPGHAGKSDYAEILSADFIQSGRAEHGEHKETAHKEHKETAHKKPAHSNWWFWAKTEPVASCGVSAVPVPKGKAFPLDAMADRGFDFRHGEEWNILTRELCEYVADPRLADFKQLMSFRWGADEMFWPTLIANIPNFSQRVAPASMWFKRWQGHGSTPHSPDLIQWPHHTPELFASRPHHLFVRKLRLPESQTTVDWLDKDADEEAKHMPANGTVAFYPLSLPTSNKANTPVNQFKS